MAVLAAEHFGIGGKIAMQILHFGRYAYHRDLVAPSALRAPINPHVPHALTADEVEQTIEDFAHAQVKAWNAGDKAGFLAAYRKVAPKGLLIEQSRANSRQGFPVGAAYQRNASALIRSDVLPGLDSIATATARVEQAVAAFILRGKGSRTKELWIYIDGAEVGARNRFLSNQRNASPAVAVRFDLDGHTYNIAADRYNTPEQNLAGIAAYIESVRAQERNGIFTVEEMLHTFAALPVGREWWKVLGVQPDAPQDVAEAAYRALVLKFHPDAGGRTEDFREITEAIEEARSRG